MDTEDGYGKLIYTYYDGSIVVSKSSRQEYGLHRWTDEAYRTIFITSGRDVTNRLLIDFLTCSATLVSSINLTNTKWQINDNWSELNYSSYNVDAIVTYNDNNYTLASRLDICNFNNYSLCFSKDAYDREFTVTITSKEGVIYIKSPSTFVIKFTGGYDVRNVYLYNWLQANATQIV